MPTISKTMAATRSTAKPAPSSSATTSSTRSRSLADRTSAALRSDGFVTTRTKLEADGAYLPELMKLLDGAKKSVDVMQYTFFSEDGSAKAIVDKLIELKTKHPSMPIRLFIEADHGDAAPRNQKTMKLLKAAGIEVIPDGSGVVTHAKAVCVDGTRLIAGSHNLSNTSVGKNNETSLRVASSELAKAFGDYFNAVRTKPNQLQSKAITSGNVTMLTDGAYFDRLISLVKGAKTSLDASMYYLSTSPNDPKSKELIAALGDAAKRGVKVRLLLEQNDGSFAPAITKSNKKAAATLSAMGVEVHLDDPKKISHQKFIVRDGAEVLMGSTNWSGEDFDRRHQLNWLVDSRALARDLTKGLEADW